MDKLKDIIYDYTDVILSILVVLAIVFIIGTNFTFFDQNLASFVNSSENGNSSDNQSPTPVYDEEVEKDDEEDDEETSNNTSDESTTENRNTESSEKNETVTIQIPEGASATQVGEILQIQGLVDDSSEFVESTENLNVSHRLRPGTFNIPRESTLREMIQILIQSSL